MFWFGLCETSETCWSAVSRPIRGHSAPFLAEEGWSDSPGSLHHPGLLFFPQALPRMLLLISIPVPPFVLLPSPNFLPSHSPSPLLPSSCRASLSLPGLHVSHRLLTVSSAPFVFDLICVESCFLPVRNYKSHSPQRLPRDLKGGCWLKW